MPGVSFVAWVGRLYLPGQRACVRDQFLVIKKYEPRDAAISVDLKEGVGPITALVPLASHLEIYKRDATFRLRSPESIDPTRSNPNAASTVAVTVGVGSSNPIVARVFLQAHAILKGAAFSKQIRSEQVLEELHACKEALLTCQNASERVNARVDECIAQVEGSLKMSRGRVFDSFPTVANLTDEVTTFLISAKRAIKHMCNLPVCFLDDIGSHSNFDHLGKALMKAVGHESAVTKFVQDQADLVRYLIDLRNFQEHPVERRTIVDDFKMEPDSTVSVPMWYLNGETPRPIAAEMRALLDRLTEIAEALFVLLVGDALVDWVPYVLIEIPDGTRDEVLPIRYRLEVDATGLGRGSPNPTE